MQTSPWHSAVRALLSESRGCGRGQHLLRRVGGPRRFFSPGTALAGCEELAQDRGSPCPGDNDIPRQHVVAREEVQGERRPYQAGGFRLGDPLAGRNGEVLLAAYHVPDPPRPPTAPPPVIGVSECLSCDRLLARAFVLAYARVPFVFA